MRRKLFLFLFIFFAIFLQAKEKENIKICVTSNNLPFENINPQGQYEGIVAEYIKLFSKKINLPLTIIETNAHNESLSYLKEGKCDLLWTNTLTSKLKKDFLFTNPYDISTYAFATTVNKPLIADISQLENKPIFGILENSSVRKKIAKDYSSAKIIPFESVDLGLQALASKEITAFVGPLPTLFYSIDKHSLTSLKINSYYPFLIEYSILINKNKKYLHDIFNNEIANLNIEDKKNILDKWLNIKVQNEHRYDFLFEILCVSLILILAIYGKNRTLSKMNNKLSKLHKELELKNDELTILSNTDSLTGIYNRRKIDEFLQEQVELFQRYGTKFSVILIDIDHFKRVNDIYGHDIGDSVLIEFSKIIKKNIRTSDKVGRWGGEEFMVVCPHNTKCDALKLANKLRKIIYKHKFEVIVHKTASFGIAQMKDKESLKSFFKRVDSYLYKAKEDGRNQIVS